MALDNIHRIVYDSTCPCNVQDDIYILTILTTGGIQTVRLVSIYMCLSLSSHSVTVHGPLTLSTGSAPDTSKPSATITSNNINDLICRNSIGAERNYRSGSATSGTHAENEEKKKFARFFRANNNTSDTDLLFNVFC